MEYRIIIRLDVLESILLEQNSITFLIDLRFSLFTLHSSDSTTPWLQDDSLAHWFKKKDNFEVIREVDRIGKEYKLLKWKEENFID